MTSRAGVSGAHALGTFALGACALAAVLMLAACGAPRDHSGTAPANGRSANQAGASGGAPFPCTGWAQTQAVVFDRAGADARRFGTVRPGDPIAVMGRNAEGWWALAPGTAQAANVGPFRWRWLPPQTRLRLQGACSDLPVRESPPPGVCFEMAMAATPIRATPDAGGAILATLPAGGYVAVTAASPAGWLRVDAASGSAPGTGTGWIAPQSVNVNGPCEPYLHRGP